MTRTSTWILSRYIISHFDFSSEIIHQIFSKKLFSEKRVWCGFCPTAWGRGFSMMSHYFRAIFEPSMSHPQTISFWWVILKKRSDMLTFKTEKNIFIRNDPLVNTCMSAMLPIVPSVMAPSGQKVKVKKGINLLRIHIWCQFETKTAFIWHIIDFRVIFQAYSFILCRFNRSLLPHEG